MAIEIISSTRVYLLTVFGCEAFLKGVDCFWNEIAGKGDALAT